MPVCGAFLFTLLAIVRTIYEGNGGRALWCRNYLELMLFYIAGAIICLLMPRLLEVWRRHAGKLAALSILLLVQAEHLTASSYAYGTGVLDMNLWQFLSHVGISVLGGVLCSMLVGRLNDHERRYILLSEGLSEALWTVDCRKDTVVYSDGFGRAFGYENVIADSLPAWRQMAHPEDVARVEASFNAAAADPNQKIWEELYRVRHRDGHYISVLDRCRFDRAEDGRARFAYGGMLNVSAHLESNRKLQVLTEELESRVVARTEALETANRELSSFTYAISHDLKSPITGIIGYADLMTNRPAVIRDPHLQTYLKNIVCNAERMASFLDELLAHANIEAHGQIRSAVPLDAIFSELRTEFSPRVHDGGRLVLKPTPLGVIGSNTLVYRILQNLISNAFKYQRPEVPPYVAVTCTADLDFVTISVSDNGLGIPPESLPHIFNFQYRVGEHAHLTGHGIGLANVKKSVTWLGGSVRVESKLGAGTTFYVRLPLARV